MNSKKHANMRILPGNTDKSKHERDQTRHRIGEKLYKYLKERLEELLTTSAAW